MSQQNGGGSASLASIEAAPPTHGLLRTITSGSHSSASSLPHNIGSPSVPSSSNTTRSSNTPSRKVDIPRLSAATTELLARVTGNLKGTQQRYDNKFIRWNPLAANRVGSNPNSHQRGAMRASSTIIELPTAPFTYSSNVVPPAVSPSTATSTVTRETPSNSTESLVNIASKSAAAVPSKTVPTADSSEISLNGSTSVPQATPPPVLLPLPLTQPHATVWPAKPLPTGVPTADSPEILSTGSAIAPQAVIQSTPQAVIQSTPQSAPLPVLVPLSPSQPPTTASTAKSPPTVVPIADLPEESSDGFLLASQPAPASQPQTTVLTATPPPTAEPAADSPEKSSDGSASVPQPAPLSRPQTIVSTATPPPTAVPTIAPPEVLSHGSNGFIVAPQPASLPALVPLAPSQPQTTPSTARPLPAAPPIPESPKVTSNRSALALQAALPPALVSLRPTQPEATSSATNSPLTASSAFKSKRPTTNGCRKRNSTTNGAKNKRRRRNRDSDDESVIRAGDSSSDESDIAPTATQTKSGRQVNRPSLYVPPPSVPAVVKETSNCLETSDNTRGSTEATRKRKRVQRKAKDVYVTCTRCQRGHSPLSNAIVFCDECNGAWHQLCHDPPIGLEVVTVKEKEWVCGECKPVPITIVQPTVVRSNPTLARAHPVSIPASSLIVPRAEVSAEGYSAEERRGFLSGLSHATLVELLVSISGSNPTLPMFPANLKEYRSSRFSFRPGCSAVTDASTSVQVPIGETNGLTHTASSMEESTRSSTVVAAGDSTVPLSRTRYEELSDEESEYEFQEHRLYPRAGNGFRLPVGLDDMDILSEDPACPTFSYSLHGPAQVRAQMKQSVPVWGS